MRQLRLATAGLVSLLGGATGAVAGLLLAVIIGRGYGPDGAGYFFQLVALFMILANVLELGADTGLVRELAAQVSLRQYADLSRTVLVALIPVLLVGALATAALWLFAAPVAELVAGEAAATMTELLTAVAPLVLLGSLLTVLLGGTRGLGGVTPFVGIFNIGLPVVRVGTVLAVVTAGLGLTAAARAWAWPLLAATALAAAILLRQLSARSHTADAPPPTPTPKLAARFWSFSASRGVAAAIEICLQWIDVLIVTALLGPAEGGAYAVASRAARAGLLVDTAMRMAVSPRISAALAVDDVADTRRLHQATSAAMILLAWPLYLTLAAFAEPVLRIFGDGFGHGVGAVVTLAGAMMVLTAAGMVQSILLMGGRSRWQLGNKAVALAVNIVGLAVLVPPLGLAGAGLAWVATVAVDAGLATWQVHRIMAVRIALRRVLIPVAVVLASVGVSAVLIRGLLGATFPALAVHLAIALPLLGAVCWCTRRRLGLADVLASGPTAARSAVDATP